MNHAYILSVNAGSSSIKVALFKAGNSPKKTAESEINKIGQHGAIFTTKIAGVSALRQSVVAPNHLAAANILITWINAEVQGKELVAIGHRVVHGGPKYSQPQRITPEVIEELRSLIIFDPQHLPIEIELIEAMQQSFPGSKQFACFDTAFHHDLPPEARLLAIPRRYASQGLRRYGFHGLSYEFSMGELARQSGVQSSKGRIILAHLGSGVSLAAVRHGKSIETTMSLTPAAGVPMSTRSGDLDPGLALYFSRSEGMNIEQFTNMVNFKSGLLGLSETSADMEELLSLKGSDTRAAEAVDLFCYQVKKQIGGLVAVLGGLDTLVFTGGMGENAPEIRARISNDLGFLGIELDPKSNASNRGVISADTSRVTIRVIHADEAQIIAENVLHIMQSAPDKQA